jgi:hypothetical protein
MRHSPLGKLGTVKLRNLRRTLDKALTIAEAQAFMRAAAGHPHEHLYVVLLATGMRLGQALAIRIDQGPHTSWADLDAGVVQIRETLEPLTRVEATERGLDVLCYADSLKGERNRDVPRWRDVPPTDEAIVCTSGPSTTRTAFCSSTSRASRSHRTASARSSRPSATTSIRRVQAWRRLLPICARSGSSRRPI